MATADDHLVAMGGRIGDDVAEVGRRRHGRLVDQDERARRQVVDPAGSSVAGVSWVQATNGGHVHKVVCVQASSLSPLEVPDAYTVVPRRVHGNDGQRLRTRALMASKAETG
jgi:hypothetical protein